MLNSCRLVPWESIPKFKGPLELASLLQHMDAVEEHNLVASAQDFEPVTLSVTLSAPILRRINMEYARSNTSESKNLEEEDDDDVYR